MTPARIAANFKIACAFPSGVPVVRGGGGDGRRLYTKWRGKRKIELREEKKGKEYGIDMKEEIKLSKKKKRNQDMNQEKRERIGHCPIIA